MKRLILLLFCLSLFTTALADSVSPNQAAKKAQSFFSNGIKTKTGESSLKLVWTWPEVQTKADAGSNPLLYVFERNGGGFAIVSGEDAAHPILGYSATGTFSTSDMPDNLRSWLEWYGEVIQCARDNRWSASPETREEWEHGLTLFDLDNSQSVQLETAQWGQQSPFNDLCPVIDGRRCPSGCVATATAIIMRYHQWPERGMGELPSYDYDYQGIHCHVDGHSLGHEYRWEQMPIKKPESGWTEEQSKQLAQLMYDVGVMAKMQYQPFLSGAGEGGAGKGLLDYFGYDFSMRYRRRFNNLSFYEWEECIVRELTEGRPVLYSGYSEGGHAMVIDGYLGRYFSINFGWNGMDNGFYLLSPIDCISEDIIRYYRNQSILYNIKPNSGERGTNSFFINGMCRFIWDYQDGPIEFGASSLCNESLFLQTDSVELCVGLFDNNEHFLRKVSESKKIEVFDARTSGGLGPTFEECFVNRNDIKDGDQLRLCYWDISLDEWCKVESVREGYVIFDRHTPLSELVSFGISYLSEEEKNSKRDYVSYLGDYQGVLTRIPELAQRISVEIRIRPDVYSCLCYEDYAGYSHAITFGHRAPSYISNDFVISGGFYYGENSGELGSLSYRLWLTPGDYTLVFRKFEEEMTIRFKL